MSIDNEQYAELCGIYDQLTQVMDKCGGADYCEAYHPELWQSHQQLWCVLAGDKINVAEEMAHRGIDEAWVKATLAKR